MREPRVKLDTKYYNKINLESALLKETYDDRTSNQSSNNTYKTGKRTLNTAVNRRLSGATRMISEFFNFIFHRTSKLKQSI